MSDSMSTTAPGGVAGFLVLDPRRAWPVLMLRGGLAIVFGVLTVVWPHVTLLALALVFGVYAVVDGVSALFSAFRGGDAMHVAAYVLTGVLGLIAGVIALAWPAITVFVLATLIGLWALVTGVAEVVAAIRLRKQIRGEAFLIVAGLVSALAGVLVFFHPFAGAVGIAILIGMYALIYGIVLVLLAFRMRSLSKQTQ